MKNGLFASLCMSGLLQQQEIHTWNLAGCCIWTALRVSAKYRKGSAVSRASASSSSSVQSSWESLSSCRWPCMHTTRESIGGVLMLSDANWARHCGTEEAAQQPYTCSFPHLACLISHERMGAA